MTKPKVHIFTDFDGTITQVDLGDDLFKQFGAFEPYHEQLLAGELGIAEYWQILARSLPPEVTPDFIRQYAESQHTDAYFRDFYLYCQEEGFELSVVSDGFDLYIKPVLEKLNVENIKIFCNNLIYDGEKYAPHFPRASESCNCLAASCKRNVILSTAEPDAIIVYIGDGYSDFCPAEYADIVFAKKKLAAYCFSNRIPHHSFHTFFEVKQIMRKLVRENRLKPRHQAFLKRKSAFETE